MDELLKKLSEVEADELASARAKYGRNHNSAHEAYAVIAEELFEEKTEAEMIDRNWNRVIYELHNNNTETQRQYYLNVERYALKTAAELIQVAAMCKKAYESPCLCENHTEA